MADSITAPSYCANCKKYDVCKYASLIIVMNNEVSKFNNSNQSSPIQISITSINYNCRHKEKLPNT